MVDGLNTSTYTPKELIAGEFPRATRVVLIGGAAALLAGTLMGRTVTGGAATGAAGAGNTGTGTIGSVTAQTGNQVGVYRITCIEPAANGGQFVVEDPNGVEIGHVAVAAAFATEIGFTIADGATDFVAGDFFTVTIAAGTEKFIKSLLAAVDGSQVPCAILAQDTDASGGDVEDAVYLTGEFNQSKLTFGTGHTAANTAHGLSQKNIYLRAPVGA